MAYTNYDAYFGDIERVITYFNELSCNNCPIPMEKRECDPMNCNCNCQMMLRKWLNQDRYDTNDWIPIDEYKPPLGERVWITIEYEDDNNFSKSVELAMYLGNDQWKHIETWDYLFLEEDERLLAWKSFVEPEPY